MKCLLCYCAYCGAQFYLADAPVPTEARCWDCALRDYRPPLLPWWRVGA